MLNNYMSILSLNENDNDIKSLTKTRPLASIPIGGRYRIIDFILSNLVNSGIRNIGILTQCKSRSLIDHLGSGKPWDLDRKLNGLFVFNFSGMTSTLSDIEMLKNNMEYLYRSKQEKVILASSSVICNIDFQKAAKFHEESGKDITVIYKRTSNGKKKFLNCNILNLDENNNILSIGKNNGLDELQNISLGMLIMNKKLLISILNNCIKTGFSLGLRQWIMKNIEKFNTNAYEFSGYAEYVDSVKSYYKVNMDMLNLDINRELFFKNGLIYTKVKDEAPTKYFNDSEVYNSLIANGSLIHGQIENSIIGRRTTILKGARLKNCIIMQNCLIKENVDLTNVIVDKNVVIDENTILKGGKEFPLVIEKKSIYSEV
ncbi:glucose-1-phosphate adenylyltransferase subunit GlgD [Clostridium felsineum]|uniref:Glycogen biosynthesis protein GlgD n=1 Tax=Clostridium felsineum TaxID=36839 RepID=A0A1S8L945_9CLOT|nr:glucose-1-phosphate adenylyltransferase subunit GlgD [Clostridium felsineum]MCR3757742.1 glucose-1-phosphate adenylyltransferase subunit GlgD [Clostridium felsineum]URZ01011.1 Glycogen biosynthesis protein GlgD [Clostridium felsineum]URZ06240.1 Glycogen biosynthesis protein GlgD [Clostridium felsineum]URZ11275.1 Glycogen biosynthesis protein GlgD [Clostridium felsineum]